MESPIGMAMAAMVPRMATAISSSGTVNPAAGDARRDMHDPAINNPAETIESGGLEEVL
jgi:hypothetical protein